MANIKNKYLILLELNELNFDIVKEYITRYKLDLPNFNKLFNFKEIRTISEDQYEHLEPWIQWPSVHTGLSFNEHNIYTLNDINKFDKKQIFEVIEEMGFKVGCISPMNTKNSLKNQSYFIPDPWTITNEGKNPIILKFAYWAIKQAVNENSSNKVKTRNLITIFLCALIFIPFKKYYFSIILVLKSKKHKWFKALFLDHLLASIHARLIKKYKPNFSTLFLNAGAHIQHHYFFNSKIINHNIKNPDWYVNNKQDPILDMIIIYDNILESILNEKKYELIVATGLTQIPYDRVKFYYRLNNHQKFINELNINYRKITPCMTRDFILEFESNNDAILAKNILSGIQISRDNINLFNIVEKNKKVLFITLSYPHEILKSDIIKHDNIILNIYDYVNFVALKNGMHSGNGYSFYSRDIERIAPDQNKHVKNIYYSIFNFFH